MKLSKQFTRFDKIHLANEICNLLQTEGYEAFWLEDDSSIIVRMKFLNNTNNEIYITIAKFNKDI